MLQIEWPGHFVAGARVRSAELLRFGPCLEGGFALPHCMGGIERMVFGLGPLSRWNSTKSGTRSRYELRLSHTFSKAPSAPLFTRKRFIAMNIVYSPDCKGQIVVNYALYVVAIARGALVSACGAPRGRSAPVPFGNAPCRIQRGQSGKHMPFLSFTTFDPIAEVGHRLRGTEYINMWPSHSLVLDGGFPADRPPLHVTLAEGHCRRACCPAPRASVSSITHRLLTNKDDRLDHARRP